MKLRNLFLLILFACAINNISWAITILKYLLGFFLVVICAVIILAFLFFKFVVRSLKVRGMRSKSYTIPEEDIS
ncbi:MAG: hypothetical protein P4L22_07895 [Candidatus Babeliales bacterium]|nr:hypothetical protein [Candidatus Babeliales bacterium]